MNVNFYHFNCTSCMNLHSNCDMQYVIEFILQQSKLEKCEKENEELLQNLDDLQKAKTFVGEELHKVETERDSALETAQELEAKLSTETVRILQTI